MKRTAIAAAVLFSALTLSQRAEAGLVLVQSFNGKVGLSTDGFGSLSPSGTISASVPAGSTVLAAYLFTAYHSGGSGGTASLNGVTPVFGPDIPNPTACCSLGMRRADVTSIVKPIIDAGPGGIYNFTVAESNTSLTDGEALVVVFSNPLLAEGSVGILEGFTDVGGDVTVINFADPLNPAAPGFLAEMRLGINFSCCGQMSTVSVNGTTITNSAGNRDDGTEDSNGTLITVGGFDDPFSPMLPGYEEDHERYNLSSLITAGDTSITVRTNNPSNDDNIFLAAFYVTGRAGFNEPPPPPSDEIPEPTTLSLLGGGLGAVLLLRRRRA